MLVSKLHGVGQNPHERGGGRPARSRACRSGRGHAAAVRGSAGSPGRDGVCGRLRSGAAGVVRLGTDLRLVPLTHARHISPVPCALSLILWPALHPQSIHSPLKSYVGHVCLEGMQQSRSPCDCGCIQWRPLTEFSCCSKSGLLWLVTPEVLVRRRSDLQATMNLGR